MSFVEILCMYQHYCFPQGDGTEDIPNDYKCYGQGYAGAIRCDGIPQCELAEDECEKFSQVVCRYEWINLPDRMDG